MKQQPTPCKFNSNSSTPMRKTLLRTSLNWPSAALALSACLAATAYGQYLPSVVTVPGDPITASSANSPASEGVKNAIDVTTAKHLNFDTANDAKPAGFICHVEIQV